MKEKCKIIIDKLNIENYLSKEEYLFLINNREVCSEYLFHMAKSQSENVFGNKIYVRGLIEFSNICRNDCFYCGIRCSNSKVKRYRLGKEEIIKSADLGYDLGFRTVVLQGGEDQFYSDDYLCQIIRDIKNSHSDMAVTLSVGERSFESYKALKEAGADRYLLRHETCDKEHYDKLHPSIMKLETRIECLKNLKKLNYQVGAGFMVGTPYQTEEMLAEEMVFLKKLNPEMVGIGPFISHKDTPFSKERSGSVDLTLFMVALTRLTLPNALIPATTALGTMDAMGREKGIMAGANVLMPNLTPEKYREDYQLYDGKICTGEEAASCIQCLKNRVKNIGCEIVVDRGDYKEKHND